VTRLLPRPAARYPADPRTVFLLGLCVASGVPLLFGNVAPGSIAALLDEPLVIGWGVMLTVGAIVSLVGIYRRTVLGVILEQVGSVAVGGASMLYAAAILLQVGARGVFSAAIITGWGLSCFWRWGQLQALLNTAQVVADHHDHDGEP
jgi:hypothetical protein